MNLRLRRVLIGATIGLCLGLLASGLAGVAIWNRQPTDTELRAALDENLELTEAEIDQVMRMMEDGRTIDLAIQVLPLAALLIGLGTLAGGGIALLNDQAERQLAAQREQEAGEDWPPAL